MDHLRSSSFQKMLEQDIVSEVNVKTIRHTVNPATTNSLLDMPACRVGVPGRSWH